MNDASWSVQSVDMVPAQVKAEKLLIKPKSILFVTDSKGGKMEISFWKILQAHLVGFGICYTDEEKEGEVWNVRG